MSEKRPKLDIDKVQSLISATLWDQKLYNEYMRNLIIYGTTHPYIYEKPTLCQRITWPVQDFMRRCRDAWRVLTGKAEIYDGQDD